MYYSPLRLAGFNSDNESSLPEKKDILLARKKLMAELDLSDDHSITVNGKELNRHDIVSIFDELNNDEQLAWHGTIFNDKVLLRFLEKGEIETGQFWKVHALYADHAFLSFISPYFAEAHNELLANSLKKGATPNSYAALLKNEQLMLSDDWEESFRYAQRFYIEKKNQLLVFIHRITNPGSPQDAVHSMQQGRAEDELSVKPADIQGWCSDQSLLLLNLFPEEFGELKYDLANQLNNICVACDQRSKFHTAYAALLKAELIETEEEMMALIRKNVNIVYSKLPGKRSVAKSKHIEKSKFNYVYIAIGVIVVILKLANMGSKSSSNDSFKYVDMTSVIAANENSAAKRSYYNLLTSLVGQADTNQLRAQDAFTDVITIAEPRKKGDDAFAGLWLRQKFKTLSTTDILLTDLKPGTVKIDNRSKRAVVAFFLKDNEYVGSVFVPAREVYNLNYKNEHLVVDIYAGSDWSYMTQNHFVNSVQNFNGNLVILKGGFKELANATKRSDVGHQNSLLVTGCGTKFPAQDKIIIIDSAGYGPVFIASSDYN